MSKSLPFAVLFLVLGLVHPFGSVRAQSGAIVLDFENADIETVIRAVSEAVGFGYVLAPDVHGKVTVRTSGPTRREDVFPLFLSILEVHGFTAVKAGDIYKILRMETARERAIPTFVDAPPAPGGEEAPRATLAPDQLVTRALTPRSISAATLAAAVRPLVSSRGSVVAVPVANVLVITDTAANVGKVAEIIERLEQQVASEEVHVIRLQYADAYHVAGILNAVFLGSQVRPPLIVPDARTNSLVIRARRSDVEEIGRALREDR